MKKQITLFAFLFVLVVQSVSVQANVPVNGATVATTQVNEAVDGFNNLSKKEKKQRLKEVKKQVNLFKKNQGQGKDADTNTILLVILAILLPPLAVYLHQNAINTKFWISLVLTLLFWVPGVIYALLVVLGVV
jgi:uncharacterized membrane protein YqaE (UPF0057 family)